MREIDECDMEGFETLDSREKTIATAQQEIIEGCHMRPNRKGVIVWQKSFYLIDWKQRNERPKVERRCPCQG